jgi:NDP-sugar pyrophosphorylase family protein
MSVGAILVIGQSSGERHWARNSWGHLSEPGMLGGSPIACLELLGQSVLDCVVEKLQRDGVKLVTVVVREESSHLVRTSAMSRARISLVPQSIDLWSAAECVLREYVKHGTQSVLMSTVGAYAELDFAQLIRFHRETKQGLTSVADGSGHLGFWVVDARRVVATRAMGVSGLMDFGADDEVASYPFRGYVNPLKNAGDLRRLVVDAFLSRCAIRPRGREVRPGIWFDDGARAHRSARIVAPAYLGCGTRLRADTLVTHSSALERGCDIHDGTVIEDASVLANTYVGKGLNVAHSVVDGNRLFPLRNHVAVEIQDGKLLRRTVPIEPPVSVAGSATSTSLAERLLATAWN